MAISSCSKQQKNTTEELGESSMVILLSLNFPYENQKCPLMFCRAGQDFYGSQLFGSSFIFESLQYGFGNLFSTCESFE
jgi:hypothetical protein